MKNCSSSLRLTAYVAKVFTMADNLVPIASNVICDAIRFLILNRQQPDGMFREDGSVAQKEITVSVTFVLKQFINLVLETMKSSLHMFVSMCRAMYSVQIPIPH